MLKYVTFGGALALIDQACKAWIEEQPDEKFPADMEHSGGKIRLHKSHNTGFSFGFLKDTKVVERATLCLNSALFGAWAYLMGTKGRFMEKTALTLTLAGGLSNLYDRLKRGFVVDYFSVQVKVLKKVIFNLADILIFMGALLLVLAQGIDIVKSVIKEKKKA